MSPLIFVTGISGYIGGHVAAKLVEKHPEYQLVALVRDEKQAGAIKKTWTAVETVIGTLDDHEILVEQGKRADVVLQIASADHIKAGDSIIEGLSKGRKGRYVHISGTGILHDVSNGYGNPSPKIYHDIDDLDEITSFDSTHLHRDVDAAVIAAGEKHGVSTAIISPPTIHGVGAGPIKTRSLQIPFLIEAILKNGDAFTVGEGSNYWDNVHVDDLAAAYVLLTEKALKPSSTATWGRQGYYFVETTEHRWGDIVVAIAKLLHSQGALPSENVQHVSPEKAALYHPWAPLLWGGNCRSRADRFRALGWKPTGPTIYDSLPEMVDFEVKSLGTQSSATTF